MGSAIHAKNAVLAGLSSLGGAIIGSLGGWDVALAALIGFMAADYVTGLIVAGVFRKSNKTESGALESHAGYKGLVRKCSILLLVFLAVLLDHVAGTNFVRPAVCLFFIGNEGLSVLENFGLMGVAYPAFLREALEALKKQGNSGEEKEE